MQVWRFITSDENSQTRYDSPFEEYITAENSFQQEWEMKFIYISTKF
jgi:hypothetical protein